MSVQPLKQMKNIVIVTDIGHDSDDLIAVLAALTAHKNNEICIKAIYCVSGFNTKRAELARWACGRVGVTNIPIIASEREYAYAPNATVCAGDLVYLTSAPRNLYKVEEDDCLPDGVCVFEKTFEGKDGDVFNKVVLATEDYGTVWCKPLRTVEFPHEYTLVDGIFEYSLNISDYAKTVQALEKIDCRTNPLLQLNDAIGCDKFSLLNIGPGLDPEFFELDRVQEHLELVVCQGKRGDSFNYNCDKESAVALENGTNKLKIPIIYVDKKIAYATKLNRLQMIRLNELSDGFYEKVIMIGGKGFRDENVELFNYINWPDEFSEPIRYPKQEFLTCGSTDTLWYNALEQSPPLYDLTAYLLLATFTLADLSLLENEWYALAKDDSTQNEMCWKVIGTTAEQREYNQRIFAELQICFKPVKVDSNYFVGLVVAFVLFMFAIA